MRKLFVIFLTVALGATACQSLKEEFQPVFRFGGYEDGASYQPVNLDGDPRIITIRQLKSRYKSHGKPVEITDDVWVRGQVISSDENGNVYRELYIQDATGALDIKIGKSSTYGDYPVGQILYVSCKGLTLGEYGYKSGDYGGAGMLQLGMLGDGWQEYNEGSSKKEPEYETSYLDIQSIIDSHIYRGRILAADDQERIQPLVNPTIPATFKTEIANELVGKLVRFSSLKYSNAVGGKQVFVLFYPNPNLNHTKYEPWNRVFVSAPTTPQHGADYTFGVDRWGLTRERLKEMVKSGVWDELEVGSGGDMYGPIATSYTPEEYFGYKVLYKDEILAHPAAQSVSHYFLYGSGQEIQIRSSGYARFADEKVSDYLSNGTLRNVTGILTRYQGGIQFTLLELPAKE